MLTRASQSGIPFATSGTQGYCGDGYTQCPGGGYGGQWNRQESEASNSGGDILLVVLLLIMTMAFLTYRAQKKGMLIGTYIKSKLNAAKQIPSGSMGDIQARNDHGSVVQNMVDKFKSENPEIANKVSYTNSTIIGGFIAIKDMSGNLLAEFPLNPPSDQ
jgi:preprotein translocase subunit YajC